MSLHGPVFLHVQFYLNGRGGGGGGGGGGCQYTTGILHVVDVNTLHVQASYIVDVNTLHVQASYIVDVNTLQASYM